MLPEALNLTQLALDISNKQKVYPLVRAETLNTFGEIYLKQKKPKDALNPFEEALTLSNNARITSSKLRSLRGIGTTYLELGQKQDALTYLRQAQEIYKNAGIDSPDSRKVMTDQEYAEFMSYLFERYVRPRLPRVRRHLDHHMKDNVHYHLGQAERSARILRFIESDCDDDGDIYGTFKV